MGKLILLIIISALFLTTGFQLGKTYGKEENKTLTEWKDGYEELSIENSRLERLQESLKDDLESELDFKTCIDTAQANYEKDWEINCEIQDKDKDCALSGVLGRALGDDLNEDKKLCATLYKK